MDSVDLRTPDLRRECEGEVFPGRTAIATVHRHGASEKRA